MQRVKNKLNFMASNAIIDMVIKKSPHWESYPDHMHCRQTRYQLDCCGQCKYYCFSETYEQWRKWKIKLYIAKKLECRHLIFLTRKSDDGPLQYCKTGARSEGFNWLGPLVRGITYCCTVKHKQTTVRVTIKVYEVLSESPLHKLTVLMSIANNKSEITNETHNDVNIRSIKSEVALSQCDVWSVIDSMPRWMRSVIEV
jgi:hypothetical protein